MEDIFGFVQSDVDRIERVVTHVEKSPSTGVRDDDVREAGRRRVQITLDADLDGTDDYDQPTNARATVKVGLDSVDSLGSKDLKITVWNRFSTSYESGAFAHAVEVEEDEKWYIDGGAGGGGGQVIEFDIIEADCPDNTWQVEVVFYSGGCTKEIPETDAYTGYVTVSPPACGVAYTVEELEATGHGFATYMYPRTGDCVPEWRTKFVCADQGC